MTDTNILGSSLSNARKNKNDEFYTQLSDIENELKYYKKHFNNKTVFCNCDDPYESEFFKYFAINFNILGLKKLIATCYFDSPIMGEQLSLFDSNIDSNVENELNPKQPYKIEISKVIDYNKDGATDLADIDYLLKNDKNSLTFLKGNGDFRSSECIDLLKESDIVVTNPPFSLFREYIEQLIYYNKKFVVIGNQNAITNKEFFPLLKDNKLWLGYTTNKTLTFRVPNYYKATETDSLGNKIVRVPAISWYTNLEISKRNETLILHRKYNSEDYPKYDNYDAINVDKVLHIPNDYEGIMGVPITFMNNYNPDQFEILGLSGKCGYGLDYHKSYKDYSEVIQSKKTTRKPRMGSTITGNPMMKGIDPKKSYYKKGDDIVHSLYGRIFIKNKKVVKQ